jgi:predicted nucleotidyltransferase
MKPHHERAIRNLADHFAKDEECLGVIVGGSVAKGLEKDDSDIDVMLVLTDEACKARWERNELFYWTADFCDYAGGYIDGKIVDMAYMRAAAERGNEVTRAAFKDAFVAHSKLPEVQELVARIAEYQPHEQREKIQSFYAQFECAYWYVGEAIRRNDRYLLIRAVSELILYGGRLVLAHNQRLYPYHKLFMEELKAAAEKPENLMELIDALLEEPGAGTARAFYDAIKRFRWWNEAAEMWQVRYMRDTELAWLENRESVGDR